MVEVTSLGHSSFKFTGKNTTVVCDPFHDEKVGIKFPRVEASVVTVSHEHEDHNNREGVRGEFLCFDTPGEYETKGAEIVGIKSFHDDNMGADRGSNTIFVYEIDDVKLCHLGDLGHELSNEQIEKIDGVDVLLIPVGGTYTIDAKKAAKVVSSIGPKIVIPMHYRVGKMTDLDQVDVFTKEMGIEPKKAHELKIKKKELGELMEIYVLTPKSK